MSFSSGSQKTVVLGEQQGEGLPTIDGGAILRRTSATFTLSTSPITNDELLTSKQDADFWLGPRQVSGTISGYLSSQTYTKLFEGMCRSRFFTGANTGGAGGISVTYLGFGVLATNTSGTFLTMGFKVGDIVQLYNSGGGASANAGVNFIITAIPNGAQMYLASTMAVPFSGEQSTWILVTGQKLLLAAGGQVPLFYTVEEWFADIASSQLSTDCCLSSLQIQAPASGFATMSAQLVGEGLSLGGSRHFPSPSGPTISTPMMANGGMILVNGQPTAAITSFSLSVTADLVADDVELGYNFPRHIYTKKMTVTGTLSAMLISSDSYMPSFLSESPAQIALVLTDSLSPGGGMISIFIPTAKLARAAWQDSSKAILRNFSFQAINAAAAGTEQTALVLQQA